MGAYEMTHTDWKKAGKSAVVFLAPVLLVYLSAVLGVFQIEGHHFKLSDLIPSQLVIDGSIFWLLNQIQGVIMRWQAGK